jgi:A/G-specific adenine glycosylase
MKDEFVAKIEVWYQHNKRNLPWRDKINPYHIWLSEIIMQQTRMDQGLDYYKRFVETYPDIFKLAIAPIDDVLKIWQGLGYYTRARNLHETARYVAYELHGQFPDSYKELLKLKGIGKYTAAAIASVVKKEQVAAIDGNVYRVLSRYYGIFDDFSSTAGITKFNKIATDLINQTSEPGDFNQALMDFGSLHCTPQKPKCNDCMISESCYANLYNKTDQLPYRTKNKPVKKRYFYYFIIINKAYTFLRRRTENDIWNSLYEFPLLESNKKLNVDTVLQSDFIKNIFGSSIENISIDELSDIIVHKLSHQSIYVQYFVFKTASANSIQPLNDWIKVKYTDFDKFPVSRMIEKFTSSSIKFKEYINTKNPD